MIFLKGRGILSAVLVLTVALLGGCASQEREHSAGNVGHDDVDFSGSWALDYRRSDHIPSQLQGFYRQIQQERERRMRSGFPDRRDTGLILGNISDSYSAIIDLARMADMITQSQVLEIEQSIEDIVVKREGNFALYCNFEDEKPVSVVSELGRELCGWDDHQFVFQLSLPGKLGIIHRLTLGPNGRQLNIATTVSSGAVTYPFTVNRVYTRFEGEDAEFNCEITLTRGRVCTTEER